MTKLGTKSDYDFGTKSRGKFEYVARELCDFDSETKVKPYSNFESNFGT